MKGLILKSYDFFAGHRIVFRVSLLSVFLLFTGLALRVSFEEDISKMLQMDKHTSEYRKILQNTHIVDKLVVSVSSKDTAVSPEELKMSYCDSLMVRIRTIDSILVKKVTASPDDFPFTEVYKALLKNLPYFLEEKDYAHFDSLFMPGNLDQRMAENARILSTPAGILTRQRLPWDPAGISNPVALRLQKLGESTGYEIINGYFFTKNKKNLVLFIEPANPANETGKNKELIRLLEGFVEDLSRQKEFAGIDCGFMGATAVSVENARQIQHDAAITLAIMCVALILLITSVFRRKRTPVLIFLPVVFGMVFALGCISLIKPDISLIAIGATSVLLGIAVNYPLHILTHRLQEPDLRKVVGDMVEPMTIGSATTIGAFLCLLFVKAEILYDFGLLGAFGLIGAVFFSLIFLPHLIGEDVHEGKIAKKWLVNAGQVQLDKMPYLRWAIILLTPVFFHYAGDIEFDSNLMNLNYMSPALKKTEQNLRGNENLQHSLYVISYGQTFDQALNSSGNIKDLADSLNQAGIPVRYTGIAGFLPSAMEQEKRVKRWREYFSPEKIAKLQAILTQSGKKSGFRADAFDNFYSLLNVKTLQMNQDDFQLLTRVFAKDVATVTPSMATIVTVLKVPVTSQKQVEALVVNQPGIRLLDNSFLSSQLGSIIQNDFNFIALFSAVMVFLALLLTYGKFVLAIIAFIPMVVSWIWILGIMGLLHVKFNIVNIMLSTFIFGLGDDYCIFTMDGLLQGYKSRKKPMPVIRMSIILSGLTTLIGFGMLLIAKHPALQSIALVSIIGILSVVVVSQVLEPFLFRMFVSGPVSKGLPPISLGTFFQSVVAYTFFILGCVFLSISGLLLIRINPFFRKRSQKILNWLISKFAWATIYIITSVTKRVVYDEKPDYSKPCVFVANHQSVLDILSMLRLSPKIILLTNQWVWNSPLFGYLVRMAGYYPIFEGADQGIDILKSKIDDGYSIAIFPEGTRTKDGRIGRFHKGAFYLAEKLELDITPVVFHNTAQCIAKGSFVVRSTTFTIKVLPRMKYNDMAHGETYQERTKTVQRLIKKHYALVNGEINTLDFVRKRVVNNFLYKGPVLEWYMKIKFRMERNYQLFHELVPKEGLIIDAGCGYGFMDYMLAYLAPARNITGFDYDEEKVEVAECGFDKPENLRFVHAGLNEFQAIPANCVIFSDVLHYLPVEERRRTFTNHASQLLPGGIIIVRDGDSNHGKKHGITRLTEFLSTRVFRFNKTTDKLTFFSAEEMVTLGENIGLQARIMDHQKWNSNLVIVFQRRPNE